MLEELEHQTLYVVPTPAPEPHFDGHKIRRVCKTNPEWYRELLAMYPRNRRKRRAKYTDSVLKRERVVNALVRLSAGRERKGVIQARVRGFIKEMLQQEERMQKAAGGEEDWW